MEQKPSTLRVLFDKHREVIMYLIFGVATTAVSWVVYSLCVLALRSDASVYTLSLTALKDVERTVFSLDFEPHILLSNTISWVVAVLFAFVTNKIWVFSSRDWHPKLVAHEAAAFIGGRVFTGVVEIVAVPLLVSLGLNQTLLGIDGAVAKIIVSVVIVILNYVISKLFVFKVRKQG